MTLRPLDEDPFERNGAFVISEKEESAISFKWVNPPSGIVRSNIILEKVRVAIC